jgi:hypothetical protein
MVPAHAHVWIAPKADQRSKLTARSLSANSDIMQRSEIRGYSIIPSARAEYFRLLGNRKNSYLLK